jgi:hypothetical protein
MGKTKQFPCPSAVFLAVVATKPYYTIVSVFVKDRCLLLHISRLGMCAGLTRRHLLAAGGSHRFHCCTSYFAYLFQYQRGINNAGNLIANCQSYRCQEEGTEKALIVLIFGTDMRSSQYR